MSNAGQVIASAARNPADLYRLFAERANAGNLEGLVALYERDATLIGPGGVQTFGIASIRRSLAGLLAMAPRLTPLSSRVVRSGDVALLSSRWQMAFGTCNDDQIKLEATAREVARCQPDGSWRFAIHDSSALLVPTVHLAPLPAESAGIAAVPGPPSRATARDGGRPAADDLAREATARLCNGFCAHDHQSIGAEREV